MEYGEQKGSIGANLKKLREDSGFSQKQIADAIHVDRSTYTNYELGKICPPLNMIFRLAAAFGVDYTILLEGEPSRNFSLADSAGIKAYELSPKEQELLLRYRMLQESEKEELIQYSEKLSLKEKEE